MASSSSLLFQPVDRLPAVGPKRAAALAQAGVRTTEDLLYYFPRRYLDRSAVLPIRRLEEGQTATVVGRIVTAGVKMGGKPRFYVLLDDGTGRMTCIWFGRPHIWKRLFQPGEWLAVSGKVSRFGSAQMVHPEFDRLGDDKEGTAFHTGRIVPLYPSGEALTDVGLDSRGFRRLLLPLIDDLTAKVEESLPDDLRQSRGLFSIAQALRAVHLPESFDQLEAARRRLKYEELFFLQLQAAAQRRRLNRNGGIAFARVGEKVKALIQTLPFELTAAQKRVLREIRADMKADRPMNRLLQGDVGSGKTVVALVAMLIAVDNGYQAVLMVPTEILAEQHYLTIFHLLQNIQVNTVLLIGGQRQAERRRRLAEIASGAAQIVVGTHALIQENVAFRQLGLAVIDEQHRFGVMQRAALRDKGKAVDLLVMTATPIPRTLAMTLHGDLDVSIIDQLPQGRKPIVTSWRKPDSRPKIYEFVRRKVAAGEQAYVVFPLVEESEKTDLKAAVESYEAMQSTFFKAFRLGLLHGRMSTDEKDAVMTAFKAGEIQILVSTTVIEVGVDVPNASIMVIEHAERFGLTQLHQLRGRVGRGSRQSYCILIAYGNLTPEAQARLEVMVETTDGFKIAERDLQLRGPGEYFGTQQSGMPDFMIADLVGDQHLLNMARQDAFALAERLPDPETPDDLFAKSYFGRRCRRQAASSWIS